MPVPSYTNILKINLNKRSNELVRKVAGRSWQAKQVNNQPEPAVFTISLFILV
jgi:hypothetical protein